MHRINSLIFRAIPLFMAVALLSGCDHLLLLDPKGPIGDQERWVILISIGLMLIVVIPVAVMTVWFPWKYRATNADAVYAPKWRSSVWIEIVIWLVPALIVSILSVIVWDTTHRLDPYKPIDAGVPPVRIEAISLDWKWVFIYPELNIATVNELVFPAKVPLSFRITSASVMTSFFIPQLGSQIYAMGGMQTQLNLLADTPGIYVGQNNQYSGRGYADMNFKAVAHSGADFDAWIQKVRVSPRKLDWEAMTDLEKPSTADPPAHFSSVVPDLFDHVMHQYGYSMEMKNDTGAPMHKMHGTGHM